MQFYIKPVDLHHYDIYQLTPIKEKLLGKEHKEKYLGYTTISLDGENVNIYYENKNLKEYSDILAKQTYAYYQTQYEKC